MNVRRALVLSACVLLAGGAGNEARTEAPADAPDRLTCAAIGLAMCRAAEQESWSTLEDGSGHSIGRVACRPLLSPGPGEQAVVGIRADALSGLASRYHAATLGRLTHGETPLPLSPELAEFQARYLACHAHFRPGGKERP